MIEAAGEALVHVATLQYVLWVMLGTVIGLTVGLIPGLGGSVGMSLLLPFVFGLEPFTGMALLIGMAAVIHTSDTFPSVLLGVPGSAGSQATIMDGYPLARQGQAERALGAAFVCSLAGGVIGALVLLVSIMAIRPIVLALGSPELFVLALLGLCMVGLLTSGKPLAGLSVAAFGLLLGMTGPAPATAEYRFTFDTLYLIDGIPLLLVALGIFAFPELLDLLIEGKPIARGVELTGSRLQGIKDAWTHKFLVVRSAILGNFIGVVPGLGGSVTDWIAYGFAQQTARGDTSQFGKGDIRGVIGPESANNAKESGTLVPTLLFGIPGSPTSAILLGGLMLLGINAGRDMVDPEANLPLTLSIVWTLALANIFGAAACFIMAKPISRLTTIPPKILVPSLLIITSSAAYQASRHWGDLLVFVLLGLFGWWMKQVGWPRAPFIIGFVLSRPAERYLHLSMSRYDLAWLQRPVVIGIAAFIVLFFVVMIRRNRRQRAADRASVEEEIL